MRPSCLNPLFINLESLSGIGPKLAKLLSQLCGPHPVDLLFHLPSGVIHRPLLTEYKELQAGTYATLALEVIEHIKPPKRSLPYRVVCLFDGMPVELSFFNYHIDYLTKQLQVGEKYFVSGRIDKFNGRIQIPHPDYIAKERTRIPQFETVYPLTGGVSGKILNKSIATILSFLPKLPEWQDETFLKQQGFCDWYNSIIKAHNPKSSADLIISTKERQRLAYDELLANQLALALVRKSQKKQQGISVKTTSSLTSQLFKSLPFELTGAQKRVIQEIKQDLESPEKMTRLLQGDVGSGKTIVALSALLMAVESGYQGILMAPTDILAHQHLQSFEKLTAGLHLNIALLTGREKGKKREAILKDLQSGEIDILIGTHALFVEDVVYKNPALCVIDEQHKFGVKQRIMLTQKNKGINLLVMSATPIPRTLALTSYGDMDISILDEKPKNRKPIITKVLPIHKASELSEKLRQKILKDAQRTQVYWVCPLVEESSKSDLAAAEKRFKDLQEIFGDRVGLVHGKMKGAEKDAIMARFAQGELDVLVATTVIEVGVDVPSASVMVIEQAERFGLAGLHQLRGRVGRGSNESVCLLLHGEKLTDTARERLKVMRDSEDGFKIAQEDLRLRGAGEVLGTRQSGLPQFKMADLTIHYDLLQIAHHDAQTILTLDPDLTSARGQALRILLYLFQKDSEVATLKAG